MSSPSRRGVGATRPDTRAKIPGVAGIVSINGRLIPAAEATVSIFDRGLLYGDGIFETIRVYDGRLFQFDEHLRRLKQSARAIGLSLPRQVATLHRQMEELLTANRLRHALLRLTITRGIGPPGLDPPARVRPTLFIFARPFSGYPIARYRAGITAVIATIRRAPPSATPTHAKSLNYLANILAKRDATERGADDALLLNSTGDLCEGTTSNLFFVTSGALYTPAATTGLLEGITRRIVLTLARRNAIAIHEGAFPPADLTAADEAFLTNTSYELMPVVRVDGRKIGNGTPGPITRRLHRAFVALR